MSDTQEKLALAIKTLEEQLPNCNYEGCRKLALYGYEAYMAGPYRYVLCEEHKFSQGKNYGPHLLHLAKILKDLQ